MIELKVDGMTCGGCVSAVKRIVANVDDKAQVDVDLPTKRVSIASDLPAASFAAALEQGGYPSLTSTSTVAAKGGCCGGARA
ncbi:MAG: heavy-metal-associated domain-containing protein [Casimicrobiaceae bacterium]